MPATRSSASPVLQSLPLPAPVRPGIQQNNRALGWPRGGGSAAPTQQEALTGACGGRPALSKEVCLPPPHSSQPQALLAPSWPFPSGTHQRGHAHSSDGGCALVTTAVLPPGAGLSSDALTGLGPGRLQLSWDVLSPVPGDGSGCVHGEPCPCSSPRAQVGLTPAYSAGETAGSCLRGQFL